MEPADLFIGFEKYFFISSGLMFVLLCPIMLFISQVGLAIREIALNTRKDDYTVESYKSLEWVCYVLFIIAWCSLAVGLFFIFKAF